MTDEFHEKYFIDLEKEISPYENFLIIYIDKELQKQLDSLFAFITKNYKDNENYKKPPHTLMEELYFDSLNSAKTTLNHLLEDVGDGEESEKVEQYKKCLLFVLKSTYFSIRKVFIGV